MRVRLRPTQLGAKGLLLLLALIAAFLATNYNNLFFLLIVFCTTVGGLGLCWTWGNLRGVTLLRLDAPPGPAGEARALGLELGGRRPRAVSVALLVDGEVVEVGDRLGFGSAEPAPLLPPRPRALAQITAVRLTSRFPFGLFRARLDLPVAAELVTHPAPAANHHGHRRAAHTATDDDDGDQPLPQGRRGSAVAGLRPFRSGDSFGDMHWKATARRGVPIVREREPEGDLRCDLVLDRRCPEQRFERALSRLMRDIAALRGSGRSLVVHSQGGGFVARDDRKSELAAQRWLAATTSLPAAAAPPPHVSGAERLPRSGHGGRHG